MEQVLVVNRAALEARLGPGPFLSQNLETIRQFILDHHTFLPREQAEYDNTVRQIIPYVILRRGRHYFLLRRLKKQTETRLHQPHGGSRRRPHCRRSVAGALRGGHPFSDHLPDLRGSDQ